MVWYVILPLNQILLNTYKKSNHAVNRYCIVTSEDKIGLANEITDTKQPFRKHTRLNALLSMLSKNWNNNICKWEWVVVEYDIRNRTHFSALFFE